MVKIILITMAFSISVTNLSAYEWIETSQQDFKDGLFEHGIYVSQRLGGTLEFVPRFDLNNDGYIDLFVNEYGGGNCYIYWGDATGYSISRRTVYAGEDGGNCDAADLNGDGYADFVISKYNSASLTIFWGEANGPNPNSQTTLPLGDGSNETSLIADFNKDGYLDIAIGNYHSGQAAVIWGSASGYIISNRTELPVTNYAAYNIETADLNNDNWLDLLIVDRQGPDNFIYWGSTNGFSANNRTLVPFLSTSPHGASVADLNNDGWLDLVFTGCDAITQAYIYWGSSAGFQNHQVLNLNGTVFGGSSVNDINGDGYLDILFIRGQNYLLKPLIYWGSNIGYSDNNRTEIGVPLNGSGGLVADFNYDGNLDIYIDNFDQGNGSYLFWGPNFNTSQIIPCESRDHHAMAREIGNTYNRIYYEDYISSLFDAGFESDWITAFWEGSQPTGTQTKMFVRSGNTPNIDNNWSGWVEVVNGGPIPESLNARYLQYKVKLIYTNPSYLPSLDSVLITYQPLVSGHDVGVMQIIEPIGDVYANAMVTPTAVIRNFGSFDEDFMVFFNIGCAYFDLRLVNLMAGAVDTITFDPWLAVAGYYNEGAATFLDTDENPDNDSISAWLTVISADEAKLMNPYPNPVTRRDRLTLTLAISNKSNAEVAIYDINGRLVKKLLNEMKGPGNYSLNTSCRDLSKGVYFVKVITGSFETYKKLVVTE